MVFGVSLLGPIASTLLATAVQQQQPLSSVVSRFRSMYQDLEPCNVTSVSYGGGHHLTQKRSIQFSHVFSSEEDRDIFRNTCNSTISSDDDKKKSLFHQVASLHSHSKPILVYLPGVDGAGISAHSQFPSLSKAFELWRMTVDKDDSTSSFLDLSNAATSFIHDLVSFSSSTSATNRTIVLVGESFGGLLAPSVALRVQDKLAGLVLINPATSFDLTQWSSVLPILASIRRQTPPDIDVTSNNNVDGNNNDNVRRRLPRTPTLYSVVGGLVLASTIPDQTQFGQIVNLILNVPVTNQEEALNTFHSLVDAFDIIQDQLPEDALIYRITNWLTVGTQVVNPRLGQLGVKTLIVAGNEDKVLPTKQESNRLLGIIPNSTKIQFKSSGHFILDSRVNLTHIILEDSNIFPKENKYDTILDWKPPSEEYTRQRIEEKIKPLRLLTGPVFFSTDKNGIRHRGLGFLPSKNDGPILFVANHQFLGQDINLIVAELIEERNLYARGLSHPILFQAIGDENIGDPDYVTYGVVPVTPKNYYRLMESGQAALLFPGGVREVFHGKNEAYTLFWPEKVDFVRIAARFNATIIPLSAIGAADSVNIFIDAPDMLKLPFGIGDGLANNSRSVMAARFDGDAESEVFLPPFALPTLLPARHYFLFGKPVETHNLDPKDKIACGKVYADIQDTMNRGFKDLLRAREKDPFQETAKRIPFELATGKPAPTFSVEDLRNDE